MIVTTTPTLQDKNIKQYIGIVTGEAILGANIVRDFFAGITDVIGGRSGAYEESLRKAKDIALSEIRDDSRCQTARCECSHWCGFRL
jgi:uncharacterized protein YbjQ (UPF0145 family)